VPIRAKGQIEPERAPELIPAFTAALRRRGLDLQLATTDITSIGQKHAEATLRALAQNGIKRLRLGFWKYDLKRSPADQLKEIAPALRDIAAACKDLGLQAGFQNHSGRTYVGAPVWDVFSIIRDLDPAHMGMCFDIGHATIEGGLSWPIEAKLIEPFYTAVYVKDFLWKKNAKGVWAESWCNLGDGMVNREFFTELKKSAYTGPISQHHEYDFGDQSTMTAHFKKTSPSWRPGSPDRRRFPAAEFPPAFRVVRAFRGNFAVFGFAASEFLPSEFFRVFRVFRGSHPPLPRFPSSEFSPFVSFVYFVVAQRFPLPGF